jgi:hypothetical protein
MLPFSPPSPDVTIPFARTAAGERLRVRVMHPNRSITHAPFLSSLSRRDDSRHENSGGRGIEGEGHAHSTVPEHLQQSPSPEQREGEGPGSLNSAGYIVTPDMHNGSVS